jgi:hypothetical protein
MERTLSTDVLANPVAAGPAWPQGASGASAGVDHLLRVLLCVFIATLVVEGPLRWAAALSGWPNLLYLRDAIPAGSVLVLLLRPFVLHRWLDLPILVAGSVLVLHALAGILLGLAPFQVAFGFKTFLYLLYGMAMWPLLQRRWPSVLRGAVVVCAVTLSGLAVCFAIGPMPWEGLEYDTAFGAVATTWRWWLEGGIERLPGFARSSFNAAMIAGISGLLAMAWLRRPWLRLALACLVFAGILATTSKGMLLAFPLAAAWLAYPSDGPGHARAGRWMVQGLCALGLALPATVLLLDVGAGVRPQEWPDLVHSAWERFSQVWPEAFELLPPGMAGVFGAGLGGIGTPQLFGFHPHRFNPGDSLAVFLLVDFGIAGIVYYALPALALRAVVAGSPPGVARVSVALLVIGYGYGHSISMLEETFFATALGLAIGAAFSALQGPRLRA